MSPKILQVNFKLTVSEAEWERIAASLAQMFADVPGLSWKIWLLNEDTGEAGGIYLFESQAALQDFLAGPIPPQIQSAPWQRDLSVKYFDIIDGVTAVTRGPVARPVVAPPAR